MIWGPTGNEFAAAGPPMNLDFFVRRRTSSARRAEKLSGAGLHIGVPAPRISAPSPPPTPVVERHSGFEIPGFGDCTYTRAYQRAHPDGVTTNTRVGGMCAQHHTCSCLVRTRALAHCRPRILGVHSAAGQDAGVGGLIGLARVALGDWLAATTNPRSSEPMHLARLRREMSSPRVRGFKV